MTDVWTYRTTLSDTNDLEGFDVHALDGDIGKIDEATFDVGASYIVVDTGPWIFGKKVLIPAGAVSGVDLEKREVWLALTKDRIKGSPEFDESMYRDVAYRNDISSYYGPFE
jgi:hypothetical protein